MEWIELKSAEQLKEIKKQSEEGPVVIFKHSNRCNISRATLDRLERKWNKKEMENVKFYFLDLLSYREISNLVADQFEVDHESPQVLIIQNGKSVLDLSHFEIDYEEIKTILIKN